jgi:hypothetical protein
LKLFVFYELQVKRNASPEEEGAHLHGDVAGIVCVPDHDIATALDYAFVSRGLDADGLEGACGRLDLFVAEDLHGDGDGAQSIAQGEADALSLAETLRAGVEDGGE